MRVTPSSRHLGCWDQSVVLVLGIPAPGGPWHQGSVAGVDLHCWSVWGAPKAETLHLGRFLPEAPLLELLHFFQPEKLLLSPFQPGFSWKRSLNQRDLWVFQLSQSLGTCS